MAYYVMQYAHFSKVLFTLKMSHTINVHIEKAQFAWGL